MEFLADWKPRIRRTDAVTYLASVHGVPTTVATLAKLACVGGGPRFEKLGRIVLYPTAELDSWAKARLSPLRRNTSDTGAPSAAVEEVPR